MPEIKYQEILDFWFKESSSKDHWAKNDAYDQKIRDRFLLDVEKAINNEYDNWQDEAKSSLALIILLDQFSRNLFRNNPKSFSQDTKARLLVIEGVDRQYLDELELVERLFYLLPLIHSEEIQDHIYVQQLGELFLKDHPNYEGIKKSWNDHTKVIKRFGRYPHRNQILNRTSTAEEQSFLKEPNSSWYSFFKVYNFQNTMSDYSIIKCNYDDHAHSILNIYNEVILTSTAIFDYKARPLESMAKWFQNKQLNNFPVIGIENEDGQLMAVGTFGTFRDWPAYKYTVEHSVAVHKDFRGIGLGKKVVLELIQEAKDRELHAIIGGIEVSNTASIKLHLNLGFKLVGTLPQVGYKFGNWLDLVLYQLTLKTPSKPLES